MREQYRTGTQYLEAATALLHRVACSHRTAGLLDAADLHWWWRTPRPTDSLPQLFWFDDAGIPEAAVVATDWGDTIALDPIIMPGSSRDWVAHVLERGLAHASLSGFLDLDVVIDRTDEVMHDLLVEHGFAIEGDAKLGVVLASLPAVARPPVSSLGEGYRLCSRIDTLQRGHHMTARNGPEVEARLRQTSLYRPDLDLLVLDKSDAVAAYGLFWSDPDTATGLVEPMRTEDAHQRRGIARHILTTGIDLLAGAGAEQIKVCFKPANGAARDLYLSTGFVPYGQTIVLSRRGLPGAA